MASGDTIASIIQEIPPSTNYATHDTTAANFPVYDFDDSTDETMQWLCLMPGQYDGTSSLKVVLPWKFSTYVGSQTCDWEAAFYRIADDADSIESFTFATAQTVVDTEAGASGEVSYAEITFTNAQADGIQGGELFVLKVTRDASGGTQGGPGDVELTYPIVELA